MTSDNREFSSPIYRVLEDTFAVSPEDAVFDLCNLSIGLPEVMGTEEKTISSLTELSNLVLSVPGGASVKVFTKRTLERWRQWHSLTVSTNTKGEKVCFPQIIFSGQLSAKRDEVPRKNPDAKTAWDLLFNLQVSGIRALQAQPVRLTPRAFHRPRPQPYCLLLSAESARMVTERLLAPATNILDRTEARQRLAQSKPAEEHLRDFIANLARACGEALGTDVTSMPTVTISGLEVTWDFYEEQPIIMVELLKEKSFRILKSLRARYAPETTLVEGLKLNSPSVILELRTDLSIRFYAKSTQTIRLEVLYGPDCINAFKPATGILSLDQAIETARRIREDAATHMNTILGLMREESIGREQDATTADLKRAVMAAFPNLADARTILSGLARHGRIRTFPSDPLSAGLRKLKELNVLETEPASPGKRNYVVTPRYESARSTLFLTQAMPRSLWIKPCPRHLRRKDF